MKNLYYIIIIALCVCGLFLAVKGCNAIKSTFGGPEVTDSTYSGPIEIRSIDSKSDLYLCEQSIEDYARKDSTVKGLFTDDHCTFYQIGGFKCSYRINLNDVKYLALQDSNVIYVKLPPLEYKSFAEKWEACDDGADIWKTFDNKVLKKKVEAQVQKRFETKQNRDFAVASAQRTINHILRQLYGDSLEINYGQDLQQHLEYNLREK